MPKRNKNSSSEPEKQQPGRKRFVNPFLFLLAKRLIDYDFVEMGDEPSDLQFAKNIYDRYKGPDFKNTTFTDKPEKRDSGAYSIAESLLKILKSKNDFRFTQYALDNFVKEIKYPLYKFKSWDNFEARFLRHPAYWGAQQKMIQRKVFTHNEVKQFLSQANAELYKYHTYLLLTDAKNNPFFSFYDSSFVTRNAKSIEIDVIKWIEEDFGILPNKVFGFLRTYTLFGSKPFFIHIDEYENILFYFILIPLKEAVYQRIKTNGYYIDVLSYTDIDDSPNYSVKHFYFHLGNHVVLDTFSKFSKPHEKFETFKAGVRALFSQLQNKLGDLTFGVVTDEKNIKIIESIGFKRKEDDNGKSNFFELNWTNIESKIQYFEAMFNYDRRFIPF